MFPCRRAQLEQKMDTKPALGNDSASAELSSEGILHLGPPASFFLNQNISGIAGGLNNANSSGELEVGPRILTWL